MPKNGWKRARELQNILDKPAKYWNSSGKIPGKLNPHTIAVLLVTVTCLQKSWIFRDKTLIGRSLESCLLFNVKWKLALVWACSRYTCENRSIWLDDAKSHAILGNQERLDPSSVHAPLFTAWLPSTVCRSQEVCHSVNLCSDFPSLR